MNLLERQLEDLKRVYGNGANVRQLPNGASLITVSQVKLPPGWNKQNTAVRFVVPVGYPFAAPDCFWAETDLRLANNTMPQATTFQPIPEVNEPGLWFSWHVQGWNPNQNNLVTYSKVIEQRLREPR